VAGRVDDVDARVFPVHRRAFCENGDAAFALEIIRIHRALGNFLVFAERAGLGEELIDEGRFAVVDVRDDRDIADIHLRFFRFPSVSGSLCYRMTGSKNRRPLFRVMRNIKPGGFENPRACGFKLLCSAYRI